jgi:hypothetical protein
MKSSPAVLDRRHLIALLGAFGVSADALAQDAVRANARAFAVLFENEHVRVLEYTSRPGMGVCGQGVHSHPRHVTIAITPVKVRITLADGKSFIAENKPGDAFWEEASTHSVENIGGSGSRAYMIELKDPPPKRT